MSEQVKKELTDSQRVEKFIAKATGKTLGRNKKTELATMFFNAYAEYVNALKQVNQGYIVYKEQDKVLQAIKRQRDYYHTLIREYKKTLINTDNNPKVIKE